LAIADIALLTIGFLQSSHLTQQLIHWNDTKAGSPSLKI